MQEIIVCAGLSLIGVSIPFILLIREQNADKKRLKKENEQANIELREIVKQTIEKS